MTPTGTRILMLIDDEPAQQRLISALAARAGWRTIIANDSESAMAMLGTHDGMMLDAILIDQAVPGSDATTLISDIRERRPALALLMLTAITSVSIAVDAMRAGATDFLVKPIAPDRLLAALDAAVSAGNLNGELRPLTEKISTPLGFGEIVGSAPQFRAALAIAAKAARARIPVLIEGESGVGKEVLAEAIHAASPREKKPMITVNCGAIPANLVESELFGHEKGAFTGAIKTTEGKIEIANGGTLFLDEVGDIPLPLQVKLLRFLQERNFERIGGRKSIAVDVRVVCATHRNLNKMIAEQSFRDDLYYRLAEVTISIPSLIERTGDAVLLAKHFVSRFAREMNPSIKGMSASAMSAIDQWQWPGNVRELENRIKRAVIMADGKFVTADDLDFGDEDDNELLLNLKAARELADRKAIKRAISRTEGNISSAAKLLGISRPTLYDLLKQYDLQV